MCISIFLCLLTPFFYFLIERASYIDNEYVRSVMDRTVKNLPESKATLKEYLESNYEMELLNFFKCVFCLYNLPVCQGHMQCW